MVRVIIIMSGWGAIVLGVLLLGGAMAGAWTMDKATHDYEALEREERLT